MKNNKKSRDFLNMWADLEHGHPEGFHRWSLCALKFEVLSSEMNHVTQFY